MDAVASLIPTNMLVISMLQHLLKSQMRFITKERICPGRNSIAKLTVYTLVFTVRVVTNVQQYVDGCIFELELTEFMNNKIIFLNGIFSIA